MKKILSVLVSGLFALTPVLASAAAGAVWTNVGPCGDPQNVNSYQVGQHFYGHGSNFKAGQDYTWVIKTTGKNGVVVNSRSGIVHTDSNGSFCKDLFVVASGDVGGPYNFYVGSAKNDNFKIVQGTVPPPPPSCVLPSTTGQIEPFTFGVSGEPTLQNIFDGNLFTVSATNDQMDYQLWSVADPLATSVSFKVQVIGKYAAYNQELGYYKAGNIGSFTHILFQSANTSGSDGNQGPEYSVTIPAADAASFGFADHPSDGSQWYSEKSLNWNLKDAMVAYSPSVNVYLLAFEDIGPGDNDYNDLVVKVYDFQCIR